MRTNRFCLDQMLAGAAHVTVTGATQHYLTRVLRLRTGAGLVVFDGSGGEYAATLVDISRDSVRLELGEFSDPQRESNLNITLAQGVARGERMDQVLQKSTELGTTAIAPLQTDHTVVRLDKQRGEKRREHWRKIIIGACEQCGRNTLPVLEPLRSIDEWLATLPADGLRLMLQPDASARLADFDRQPPDSVFVLIGPEGKVAGKYRKVTLPTSEVDNGV